MGLETLKQKDILSIADLDTAQIEELLAFAVELKAKPRSISISKVLGLLFYKASTRTRVSFTVAMYHLGGQVVDLNPSRTQVGRGEPIADTARVLDRYLDVLAIRTFDQNDLTTFAKYADIPIINALSDLEHPCQILADLLTIRECFGSLAGISMAYLGDGNNVAHSLLLGGALMGMDVRLATPSQYQPDPKIVKLAQRLATGGAKITVTEDPNAAIEGVQVIYTDVWASMGQESESGDRLPLFQPYQVNQKLVDQADSSAIILHCLPAHRGEEITEEVLEGSHSRVWQQAENRMHAQKALLACVLGAV